MADPYHFDTDPDPGPEKIRYGSGSRPNFETDSDSGKKRIQYQENLINLIKKRSYPRFSVVILLKYFFLYKQ